MQFLLWTGELNLRDIIENAKYFQPWESRKKDRMAEVRILTSCQKKLELPLIRKGRKTGSNSFEERHFLRNVKLKLLKSKGGKLRGPW